MRMEDLCHVVTKGTRLSFYHLVAKQLGTCRLFYYRGMRREKLGTQIWICHCFTHKRHTTLIP